MHQLQCPLPLRYTRPSIIDSNQGTDLLIRVALIHASSDEQDRFACRL